MYDTILLAVALQQWERYSTHALAARDVAAALARSAAKQLQVLSVYDYKPTPTTGISPEMAARFRAEEIQRTDVLMARRIDEYVAPLVAEGFAVSKILRVGNPRQVIVQVATQLHAELLIIGSHSKRGLFDVALGGTAQQVSKSAPCTVVLVSPQKQAESPA